jgi:cystathionine beta-synthase
MTAEVMGSVVERDLLDALFAGRAALRDPIGRHMSPPMPTIGGGQRVAEAVAVLSDAGALMVLVDGKPAGILTRQDLLSYLGARPEG